MNRKTPFHSTQLSLLFSNSYQHITQQTTWLEPSKPQESPPVVRHQESNSPPRQQESPHQHPVVSRSLTDISQVPLPSEKLEDSKNLLNYLSESFHSKDWLEKSLKISRPIWDSNLLQSVHCKNPSKHTSSPSLKTLTCVLSTQRESLSKRRISNSQEDWEVKDPKLGVYTPQTLPSSPKLLSIVF